MSVECGLQGSAMRDSGGATAEACAPSAKFTLPPQTLSPAVRSSVWSRLKSRAIS
jgi:hypothetical protein